MYLFIYFASEVYIDICEYIDMQFTCGYAYIIETIPGAIYLIGANIIVWVIAFPPLKSLAMQKSTTCPTISSSSKTLLGFKSQCTMGIE